MRAIKVRQISLTADATNADHRMVEEDLQNAMKHVPLYQAYYRFRLYWGGSDGIHQALFPGPENDGFRRALERSITAQVGDGESTTCLSAAACLSAVTSHLLLVVDGSVAERLLVVADEELLAKVLPDYPPFCSRVLVDNDWVKTLKMYVPARFSLLQRLVTFGPVRPIALL